MFRIVFVVIAIAVVALGIVVYQQEFGGGNLSGVVYDCETNQEISGAHVNLLQMSILTWEKRYQYAADTDASGFFSINYKVGYHVHATVSKDGYLPADEWGNPGKTRIGVMKKSPNDRPGEHTRMCKRSFECLKTVMKDNISTTTDVCGVLPQL